MASPGEWRGDRTALDAGRSAKLRFERAGRTVEAFVVQCDDSFYAYLNRCPHLGTPLDVWPNEFFSEDGTMLVCSTHGAVFEPATGRCVAGPCAGDRLTPLDVSLDGERVVVRCPDLRQSRRQSAHGPSRATRA